MEFNKRHPQSLVATTESHERQLRNPKQPFNKHILCSCAKNTISSTDGKIYTPFEKMEDLYSEKIHIRCKVCNGCIKVN